MVPVIPNNGRWLEFPCTRPLDNLHEVWLAFYALAADESVNFKEYRPELYVFGDRIAIERLEK